MDHVTFEEKLERNPLRMAVREYFEVKPLRKAAEARRIDRALHFCSRDGKGTVLLHKYFAPAVIVAVDPDERLVEKARESVGGLPVVFSVGSLASLAYGDASFDAVFILGELHNYPNWRECLDEISRVTEPGGLLLIEDLSAESFEYALGRYFRARTEHQYDSMLRLGEFHDYIQTLGYEVLRSKRPRPFGLFTYFVAAARKKS